jgi:hypothetical protein
MVKKTDGAAAKTADLPTMEDRAIQPLHDTALEYDKVKKQRMKLTTREVELKNELRTMMKSAKRKRYAYDGVEVVLEPPDDVEAVKVKVTSDDGEASTDE